MSDHISHAREGILALQRESGLHGTQYGAHAAPRLWVVFLGQAELFVLRLARQNVDKEAMIGYCFTNLIRIGINVDPILRSVHVPAETG